ncbi:MAG TPA: hypothetical protein VGZ22_16545, partial [Isosphaeraceae bacterium]|nr:hypothetical protein [Isosphaeraceae bacterium]
MRHTATMFVAASLCLLIAADDPPKEAKKDPQASFEPKSGPGAGQKLLEKFAGDWDVTKVFYPRSGEPVRAAGQCR